MNRSTKPFSFHPVYLMLLLTVLCTRGIEAQGTCDRNTGPAGVAHCFLETPYYSKYQCATCVTDTYMQQKSGGKHHCRDRTATYCYYQCMLELHGIEEGPVYSDCECSPNGTLAQPSVILPARCYSPDGTDCTWYRQCLSRMFPCTGQAEYAISYGEKFCNLYDRSSLDFSSQARQWINAASKCLQVALVPVLHLCQVQPTCKGIKTMAFNSHVPCYVSPYQGFSVCYLPFGDWARIFWTIKGSFVSSAYLETLKASVLTAANCTGTYAIDLGKQLFSIGVWLWDNTIEKRVIMSDDELAHAVVVHISSSLGWGRGSTIDWYAFAANISAVEEAMTTPAADRLGRELRIQLFVVDRVEIGLNVSNATKRRRFNQTISDLSDAVEQGLTGTVGNFRFDVTSLRQCASADGINDGCSNGTVVATGPPLSSGSALRLAANMPFQHSLSMLVAVVAFLRY